MKKLIFLIILLAGVTFAQRERVAEVSNGVIWNDTLSYTTASEPSDSVWIVDTRFSQAWYRVFFEGNANAQADSVYYQHGTIRYDQAEAKVDTIWGSWGAVKDSAWGDINTMINNTVGKDFLLFSPIHQLLRFSLLNYRAAIPTRTLEITLQAIKP